jgi:sulfoxide reductase heme-binding subunit YedZ
MTVDYLNVWARKIPVWCVYVVYLLPMPYFFYLGLTGGLGAEPIKALEHEYGEIALQLVIIGLVITPLRRFTGINLIKFRRAIGLVAFAYVLAHLLVWLVLDVQVLSQIWADILKRTYITVGMAAFLLMLPLALTSNNWALRRMGRNWRTLHKLTYGAAILGSAHFIWLVKGIQIEPLAYMAVILLLLSLRLISKR